MSFRKGNWGYSGKIVIFVHYKNLDILHNKFLDIFSPHNLKVFPTSYKYLIPYLNFYFISKDFIVDLIDFNARYDNCKSFSLQNSLIKWIQLRNNLCVLQSLVGSSCNTPYINLITVNNINCFISTRFVWPKKFLIKLFRRNELTKKLHTKDDRKSKLVMQLDTTN